jgi:hypothetical protein
MAKAKPVARLSALASTAHNARLMARARLSEMYEWSEFVDKPYCVHELHNLRIAAKRLRYTLEIFADALPPFSADAIEVLTRIQDELGVLHDSDVLIALLRLCLGSYDAGYNDALRNMKLRQGKGRFQVPPDLVAVLLDPAARPSADERYGLERLLQEQQVTREIQYAAFRQYWYALQARDFRRQLLNALDTSGTID